MSKDAIEAMANDLAECHEVISLRGAWLTDYEATAQKMIELGYCKQSEIEGEVERLKRILNSYALQYGTATDQQDVIDKAKGEIASEIIDILIRFVDKEEEHIDTVVSHNWYVESDALTVLIRELQKKYKLR